ncbi:MAG: STAS domain-containing protein [Umezawaea sp.]|uniref:STAS domain-containing protein n=1 Tax=Umezawaea tangerina TaxID=84725 RepID=UPI000D061FE3|nr:STAS domain-containing protein [Umezawaea tangerina]
MTSPDGSTKSTSRDVPTVLRMTGEIDMSNSDALREQVVEALDEGTPALVLDMSEVTFFASSGIAALAHAREYGKQLGGRPVHVVASRSVRRSLEATAMDQLLPLHPTLEDALNAVR